MPDAEFRIYGEGPNAKILPNWPECGVETKICSVIFARQRNRRNPGHLDLAVVPACEVCLRHRSGKHEDYGIYGRRVPVIVSRTKIDALYTDATVKFLTRMIRRSWRKQSCSCIRTLFPRGVGEECSVWRQTTGNEDRIPAIVDRLIEKK
jgi:hypothetical protein